MGLLTGLLTLPLAPVRGVAWVGENIKQQAEQELYDPVKVRRQIEEVEEMRAAGLIGDEEAERIENELVQRLLGGQARATG